MAIAFYAAECCWVNGLGNTPGGQAQWVTHDQSLLRLSRITPVTCTAGTYPCNANGRTISAAGECYEYDASCKASNEHARARAQRNNQERAVKQIDGANRQNELQGGTQAFE